MPLLQNVSTETALATLTRHSAEQVVIVLNQKQLKISLLLVAVPTITFYRVFTGSNANSTNSSTNRP